MSERDRTILEKIVEYCNRAAKNIERYHRSYSEFCNDLMFQDACCMCILQIGELSGKLSDELKNANAHVPWRVIKDTRNVYVHAYGSINAELVWHTLNEELPELKRACQDILSAQ